LATVRAFWTWSGTQILAREVHASFELGSVGLDETFASDFVGQLGDVLVGEAAAEMLFEDGL
jgi:hypothetical protein